MPDFELISCAGADELAARAAGAWRRASCLP